MSEDKQKIVKNAARISKKNMSKVQCLECGEVLISQHLHDFQHCSCINYTFVDGGTEYRRYGGRNMSKILLL